jgi:hypothetical protein
LPLEFAEGKVTEFLLVPFVGACIHTPPPPPNQIIHVKVESGFRSKGMFEPVWVDGVIKAEQSRTEQPEPLFCRRISRDPGRLHTDGARC